MQNYEVPLFDQTMFLLETLKEQNVSDILILPQNICGSRDQVLKALKSVTPFFALNFELFFDFSMVQKIK